MKKNNARQSQLQSMITVAHDVDPAIVSIHINDKFNGSGVVVAPDTVITCFHVVEKALSADITINRDRQSYPATIVRGNAHHDLCLLHCPGLPIKPATLGQSATLNAGDPLVAIGTPYKFIIYSPGFMQKLYPTDESALVLSSCLVQHGNSGGGLFNKRGELTGITFSLLSNAALPVEWVKELLQQHHTGIIPIPDPPQSEVDWHKVSKSIESCREWVAAYPESYLAHAALGLKGVCESDEGKRESVAALEKAASLHPQDAMLWAGMGQLYNDLEQPLKAIARYRQAAYLAPVDPYPLLEAGKILRTIGKYDEALKAFETADSIEHSDATIDEISLTQAASGDLASAMRNYEKEFQEYGRSIPSYIRLITGYLLIGCEKAAEQALHKGMKVHPKIAYFSDELITLYEKQGKADKAAKLREQTAVLREQMEQQRYGR